MKKLNLVATLPRLDSISLQWEKVKKTKCIKKDEVEVWRFLTTQRNKCQNADLPLRYLEEIKTIGSAWLQKQDTPSRLSGGFVAVKWDTCCSCPSYGYNATWWILCVEQTKKRLRVKENKLNPNYYILFRAHENLVRTFLWPWLYLLRQKWKRLHLDQGRESGAFTWWRK